MTDIHGALNHPTKRAICQLLPEIAIGCTDDYLAGC
jgi:hypothetical protein